MKIREILQDFSLDDDLQPASVVKLYKAIVLSGKDKPGLSDYTACPSCGDVLDLFERVLQYSGTKGVALSCRNCGWEISGDEWDYLPTSERESLLRKYGPPRLDVRK